MHDTQGNSQMVNDIFHTAIYTILLAVECHFQQLSNNAIYQELCDDTNLQKLGRRAPELLLVSEGGGGGGGGGGGKLANLLCLGVSLTDPQTAQDLLPLASRCERTEMNLHLLKSTREPCIEHTCSTKRCG